MDNPEETEMTIENRQSREIQGIQDEQKHNTICVGHYYLQTNTNNVNKT